jgi:hypothetical protein
MTIGTEMPKDKGKAITSQQSETPHATAPPIQDRTSRKAEPSESCMQLISSLTQANIAEEKKSTIPKILL